MEKSPLHPGWPGAGGTDIPHAVRKFIREALKEDIGKGDITTELVVPKKNRSTAVLTAKSGFVLAGLPFAEEVFRSVEKSIAFEPFSEEGGRVRKSTVLARITGRTRTLLSCERVALNILQRLSGIATGTSMVVRKVQGTGVTILDTRKTTPGMRWLEKYAVRTGGGANHRFGLYDAVLIKDNHIEAAGGIREAVALSKKGRQMKVEVEAENLKDVRDALEAGADTIMLDNMPLESIREAVKITDRKAALEVSGNVSLDNVRELAETGVDFISVGALTHSAAAADISMKLLAQTG
jgi:nicotinate-nucleotide pyrophosphorylase (carboxylating)